MIHEENPFQDPPDQRDPVRRFRGRLSAPVTIVTAGTESEPTGLTVSSLFVVEGEPGIVQLVVGPSSDLWAAVEETGRFVSHICSEDERPIAEVFAGLRPSPGGLFAGLDIEFTEWGPVITSLGERAYCQMIDMATTGYSGLITATIDHVEVTNLDNPLIYFRGRYRSLG